MLFLGGHWNPSLTLSGSSGLCPNCFGFRFPFCFVPWQYPNFFCWLHHAFKQMLVLADLPFGRYFSRGCSSHVIHHTARARTLIFTYWLDLAHKMRSRCACRPQVRTGPSVWPPWIKSVASKGLNHDHSSVNTLQNVLQGILETIRQQLGVQLRMTFATLGRLGVWLRSIYQLGFAAGMCWPALYRTTELWRHAMNS